MNFQHAIDSLDIALDLINKNCNQLVDYDCSQEKYDNHCSDCRFHQFCNIWGNTTDSIRLSMQLIRSLEKTKYY